MVGLVLLYLGGELKVPIETGFGALAERIATIEAIAWLKIHQFSETQPISNHPKEKWNHEFKENNPLEAKLAIYKIP